MPSREDRAERVRAYIADILRRNWDPIGIKDEPAAQGEYEAYVGGVYRLIAAGATARQLAEHLVQIETDRLGFVDTDPKMLIPSPRSSSSSTFSCRPVNRPPNKRLKLAGALILREAVVFVSWRALTVVHRPCAGG